MEQHIDQSLAFHGMLRQSASLFRTHSILILLRSTLTSQQRPHRLKNRATEKKKQKTSKRAAFRWVSGGSSAKALYPACDRNSAAAEIPQVSLGVPSHYAHSSACQT